MAMDIPPNLNDKRPARVLWLIFVILAAGIVLSGGTFSTESSPGHGTVVQVTWPEKTGAGEESGDGGE
jgi:hypothetical protein